MNEGKPTTGAVLLALKMRAGNLSLEAIARAAGYNGRRSSVQAFFNKDYRRPLNTEVAGKLADALEGKGNPPITREELFVLTGVPIPKPEPLPRGGRVVGEIDMTPTWRGLIPLFIAAIEEGTPQARKLAIEELYRLADAADAHSVKQKETTA